MSLQLVKTLMMKLKQVCLTCRNQPQHRSVKSSRFIEQLDIHHLKTSLELYATLAAECAGYLQGLGVEVELAVGSRWRG